LIHLAAVLQYPDERLGEHLDVLRAETAAERVEAAEALEAFRSQVTRLPLDRLREIYAATFDLNPACCLYAGYHLFGDSYKRGALMAKLNAEYRSHGFEPERELPDHLTILFRFLAGLDDPELRSALLEEVVLPAVERIVRSFQDTDNVYADLARAVLLALSPKGYTPPVRLSHSLPVLEPDGSLTRG
jgi:nitrate reductase delta subunit